MNCDECQEQVFELIERESVDPQAVREVLDRCPECRALFEEMKAALADVAALPSEEPPAEIDVAILRAARERVPKATPRRRKWFQSTQWAVAAATLLAIGVGVWAIPKGEEVAMEEVAMDEVAAEAVAMEGGDAPEIAISPTAKSIASPAARKRSAERQAVPSTEQASLAVRDASSSAAEAFAGAGSLGPARVDTDSAEDASASGARAEPQRASRECARRLAKVERRAREGGAKATTPEDALAIGRCYQAVGNVAEARRWLERAASHPQTKDRAARALSELPAE
jgi:hypothetical protein